MGLRRDNGDRGRLSEPRREGDRGTGTASSTSVDGLAAAMGVGAFRNRTLGHVAFPYAYPDARYMAVRDDTLCQVVSRAVAVVTGISAEGAREVLGVDLDDNIRLAHATAGNGFPLSPGSPAPRGRGIPPTTQERRSSARDREPSTPRVTLGLPPRDGAPSSVTSRSTEGS